MKFEQEQEREKVGVMKHFRLTNTRVGLVAAATVVVCGCLDETSSVPSIGDPPATSLTALESDSLIPMTSKDERDDGDESESRDRGRTTVTPGAVGHIEIEDFFIGGVFFQGGSNILRARSHAECVVHLFQPVTCCFAPAGTLTVTSDNVGTPGGPTAPFAVNPDPRGEYFEFPDPPLFNYPDGSSVRFELAGNSVFPPISSTTLRSPPFGPVKITAPPVPDSFQLAISSTAPLKVKWEVPATHHHAASARHAQSLFARLFVIGPVQWAMLYCNWPISAGHGSVPAVLLRAMREQLGGTEPLFVSFELQAGEFKEFATPASSYTAFVSTDTSTVVTTPNSTTLFFFFGGLFD
jgi:hypothetical protein